MRPSLGDVCLRYNTCMNKHLVALAIAACSIAAAAAGPAAVAPSPSPAAHACPIKHLPPQPFDLNETEAASKTLDAAYDAALGADARQMHVDKVSNRVSMRHIDDTRMAALAEAAGCAALFDQHASCATFFDLEYGNPLSVFMNMKRATPLRQQFDAAIARLPDPKQRNAAQYCIKLVGKR